MSEQITLITILKEVIADYEQSIAEVSTLINSSFTINKEKISKLRKDTTSIIDIDSNALADILREAETKEEEAKKVLNYLEAIKSLLKLNKERQTTFKISEEQNDYIKYFLEKVNIVEKKHREIKKTNPTNLDELNKLCSKYKALLNRLEDENDSSYITNIDLLKLLFKECKLDEQTKRNIMLNLMQYNQNIYYQGNI